MTGGTATLNFPMTWVGMLLPHLDRGDVYDKFTSFQAGTTSTGYTISIPSGEVPPFIYMKSLICPSDTPIMNSVAEPSAARPITDNTWLSYVCNRGRNVNTTADRLILPVIVLPRAYASISGLAQPTQPHRASLPSAGLHRCATTERRRQCCWQNHS